MGAFSAFLNVHLTYAFAKRRFRRSRLWLMQRLSENAAKNGGSGVRGCV
ncbi:hypothetical protein [Ruminococcus sp.]|nr:hypothetical protein [Ruminococcus sp.]MEE1263676.1 hypothetical protein [Ruminococcus sp.]